MNLAQKEEDLIINDLANSSNRIRDRAVLINIEARQHNQILSRIEQGAENAASLLNEESDHVNLILAGGKNDCYLKLGVIINITLLIYLLATSL